MDMATISTAVSSVKTAIDIAKTLKDSDDLFKKAEVKLQLAELINSLADIKMQLAKVQEELIISDKEKNELREKLSLKENLIFERPYYIIKQNDDKNDGPFCQICYDNDNKLIRLHDCNIRGAWDCPVCHQNFHDKDYDFEEAKKRAKIDLDFAADMMSPFK